MSQETSPGDPATHSLPKNRLPSKSRLLLVWLRASLLPIVVAAAVILFAVQQSNKRTNPQSANHQLPQLAKATITEVARDTSIKIALPTVPSGGPVTFKSDKEVNSLYASQGVVYYGEQTKSRWSPWIGPSRLLVTWLSVSFDGPRVHEAYVLNLESGALEHLPGYEVHMSAYSSADGSRVAFLDLNNDAKHQRILLSNLESSEVTTIYDVDAKIPQWAGEDVHPASQGFSFDYGSVAWVSRDAFLVNMSPGLKTSAVVEGRSDTFLLVDILTKKATLLPEGVLAGTLPDGTILLSRSSPTGENLYTVAPPYLKAPKLISESGSWISSVEVSPDGKKVAWLETQPDAKYLSGQHRFCFEQCTFHPTPRSIAVWDRDSNQVKHLPLASYYWDHTGLLLQYMYVMWSKDNVSLFYHTLVADKQTGLYKLSPDGSATLLIKYDVSNGVFGPSSSYIRLVGEQDDGAIYYTPSDVNGSLLLRKPDGTTETIAPFASGVGYSANADPVGQWSDDISGHILVIKDNGVAVIDVASGETHKVSFLSSQVLKGVFDPFHNVRVSSDGQWVAYSGWDSNQFMSLEGMPDHNLVLRVARAK